MQLNIEQKKLVQSKPNGHSIIRGVAGSGKTTIAVNRIPFLLQNYCNSDDDMVLMVTYNKSLISYIKYAYDKVEDNREYENISFFKPDKKKLKIKNIDSLMYGYFIRYCRDKGLKYNIESNKTIRNNMLQKSIAEVKKYYSDVKILSSENLTFISDEISWIKSCGYLNVEEYQNVDRIGRAANQIADTPQKLQKNSKVRNAIFNVMQTYDKNMRLENKVDFEDCNIMALRSIKNKKDKKYTHIIVDESQDMTKVQLEFIYNLLNSKSYSSILFVMDTAQSIYSHAWLIRGRTFASVGFDVKGRSSILTKNYRTTTQIAQAAYSLVEKDPRITEDENYVKPSLLDKQGTYPVFRSFKSTEEESCYVTDLIKRLSKDYKLGDIVVLSRINEKLIEFSKKLKYNNIPYKIMGHNDGYEFGDEKVKLLTIHSVKGLEFKVVIMIGIDENIIPLKNISMIDKDYYETMERKLMYVGMTRATERLYITSSCYPSKFIKEINPKFLKFNEHCNISSFYALDISRYCFKEKIRDIYSSEEKIRQWVINELKETYNYPLELLDIEYQVNHFSEIGYVDISVSIYKNDVKIPYIFVEVKRSGSDIKSCIEQLKSYMSTSPTCEYGIATNGVEFIVIDKNMREVNDIPCFKPSMRKTSIEKFLYVDFKNNAKYKFMRDCFDIKEIIFEDEKTSEISELERLNVFDGIACGNPILINSVSEEEFYFPKKWLRGDEPFYMIKAKGNSMINANINDGDIVVVRKQNVVDNCDIAAVEIDGSTTLKRFVRMGSSILLMPENPEFEPIQVNEGQFNILGLAVGVVKKNH